MLCQYFEFDPTSLRAKPLQLLTSSSISLVIVLEYINLILLGSTKICRPCTTNKDHRIDNGNIRKYTISDCFIL